MADDCSQLSSGLASDCPGPEEWVKSYHEAFERHQNAMPLEEGRALSKKDLEAAKESKSFLTSSFTVQRFRRKKDMLYIYLHI